MTSTRLECYVTFKIVFHIHYFVHSMDYKPQCASILHFEYFDVLLVTQSVSLLRMFLTFALKNIQVELP